MSTQNQSYSTPSTPPSPPLGSIGRSIADGVLINFLVKNLETNISPTDVARYLEDMASFPDRYIQEFRKGEARFPEDSRATNLKANDDFVTRSRNLKRTV